MDRVAGDPGREEGAFGGVHPAVGTAEVDVVVDEVGHQLAQGVLVGERAGGLGQPRVAVGDSGADRVEDPGTARAGQRLDLAA